MSAEFYGTADFCGCCGNACEGIFCSRCTSSPKHLGPSYLLAWDRTYFAIHGVDCPYQAAASAVTEADE